MLNTDGGAFEKSEVFRVVLGGGLLSVIGDGGRFKGAAGRIRSYTETLVDEISALIPETTSKALPNRRLESVEDRALREAVSGLNSHSTLASLALPGWLPTLL